MLYIHTQYRKTSINIFVVSILSSLFLCFSLSVLESCKTAPRKPAEVSIADTVILAVPAVSAITEIERTKLYQKTLTWYDTVLKNSGFNGGMLVAKGGNIVFEKYKGTVRLGGKDSITSTTPFHIASVSKTITAMATLKLWQDGKINLDDLYSKYFPTFNYPGITIRNLLSHRSGLPNYLYFMEKLWANKKVHITNQDVFNYLVNRKSELTNIAPPDTRFTYCNTNYALLALLIEKVTGEQFPAYIKKTFFIPLQMNNTFIYTSLDSASVPPNYDWRGREIPLMYLDDVYGDKNVYSTVRDLLKWDRALSSNVIFKQATLDEAYKPYSNERPGVKNYGLGWRMDNFPNGKKMIFHNGWWHGNNAAFIRLHDEDATIILVNNHYTAATYKAKNLINIFANYFDKPQEDESENAPPLAPSLPYKLSPSETKQNKTTFTQKK